jgi:hypothetical protein
MLDKPYKQQLELNFPDRVFRFHVPKSRFGVLLQQRHIKARLNDRSLILHDCNH